MDVEKVNQELKAAKVGLTIEVRGSMLSLRGTFPPKPGKTKPSQQRLSLNIKANTQGIKYAKAEALRIAGLIATKQFDWNEFLSPETPPFPNTFSYWISQYESHYFNLRERNKKSESTWNMDYAYVYSKLPQGEEINERAMIKLINTTQPDSRQRRRFCIALQALAKFAKLEVNLLQYKGNYSPQKTRLRELPSDELIVKSLELINNNEWRVAYILIAAYGLRPSEINYLDRGELPKLRILEGKTGARLAYPLPVEWLNLVDIQGELPKLTGKSNKVLGERVSQYFRRRGIPFTPYDLRHAWAVRCIMHNIPTSIAAKWMGHSVAVHTQTYEKWMGEKMHEEAFNKYILLNTH